MQGEFSFFFWKNGERMVELHKMGQRLLHNIPKIAVKARKLKEKTKSLLRKHKEIVYFE